MKEKDDLMTLTELIDYLPIAYSRGTIYQYVGKGKIPVYKRNKPLLFSKKQIDKWFNDKINANVFK